MSRFRVLTAGRFWLIAKEIFGLGEGTKLRRGSGAAVTQRIGKDKAVRSGSDRRPIRSGAPLFLCACLSNAEEAETVTEPDTAESASETPQKAEPKENPDKKAKMSSNPLRDAQREYLQIPESSKAQRAAESAEDLFGELHTFFQNAQGAEGIVYFGAGVRERTLTVRILDNDDADGDRMFLLGLLGTDTPETTVAVNATAYMTIEDDENRESAVYSVSADRTILSPDNPTATVKARRSGGTQYFGTAFISTVKGTALSTAYEKLDLKSVGFTPGQREAEVTVTATDFTDGGEFGLRLETQAPDAEGNNYLTFVIEKAESDAPKTDDSAESIPDAADENPDDAQLLTMASGKVLGSSSIAYGNRQSNSFSSFPGGWSTEITGGDNDNRASVGSQFYIAQYDKNKRSMVYSRWSYNFNGVYNIRFSMYVGGDGSKFTTYFETDSDQSYSGSTKSYSQGGNRS